MIHLEAGTAGGPPQMHPELITEIHILVEPVLDGSRLYRLNVVQAEEHQLTEAVMVA